MFCPKCKTEYQDGYTVCEDCHTDLVAEIPRESATKAVHHEFTDMGPLFNPGDIPIIKSIFDEENIIYFLNGENTLFMIPGVPARLMVREDQVERAQEILKDIL